MRLANSQTGTLNKPPPSGAAAISSRYEAIKPSIDRVLALAILLFTTPVVVLAVFLVRLTSRGAAIYGQRRLGLHGQVFTIYKIRTMFEDSERSGVARWCAPGDPRITPVGRLLRSSHLDELPQLINVLKGEMSLVGPRPERPEFLASLEYAYPEYRLRLAVRPGLTGLAQVQKAPDTDLASVGRKLNYDLCYVERMGPWLDFRLMLGTALKCIGVPFRWIGRLLQLPDPDIYAR